MNKVININDQTVRLHDENERLNSIILKYVREVASLKANKHDLSKLNMVKINK